MTYFIDTKFNHEQLESHLCSIQSPLSFTQLIRRTHTRIDIYYTATKFSLNWICNFGQLNPYAYLIYMLHLFFTTVPCGRHRNIHSTPLFALKLKLKLRLSSYRNARENSFTYSYSYPYCATHGRSFFLMKASKIQHRRRIVPIPIVWENLRTSSQKSDLCSTTCLNQIQWLTTFRSTERAI